MITFRTSRSEKVKLILGTAAIVFGVILVMATITALPVMIAWDLVMPHAFGLPEINLIQAFCLVLLSTIFFRASAIFKDKT